MKIQFCTVLLSLFSISLFSQIKEYDIKLSKLEYEIRSFNGERIINYDKSFVTDDRIFYENLGGRNSYTPKKEKNITEKKRCFDNIEIKKALNNYIEGSSSSKTKLLKSVFTEDATLYLTGKEGFKRYSPEEYTNFFKNRVPNKFNGRYGKIISIECYKDVAMAKVEISIPKLKWIFMDLFLLKKFDKKWKIISKTATRIDETK